MDLIRRRDKLVKLEKEELDQNWDAIETEFTTLENRIITLDNLLAKTPTLVSQMNSAVIRKTNNTTDTTFLNLAQVTIPCGDIPMGPNSKLQIVTDFDFTNSTNRKSIAVNFGGSNISGPWFDSNTQYSTKIFIEILNLQSLTTQKIHNSVTYSTGGTQHITTNKDTSGDVLLEIMVKWNVNLPVDAEFITLVGYSIYHYPGNPD